MIKVQASSVRWQQESDNLACAFASSGQYRRGILDFLSFESPRAADSVRSWPPLLLYITCIKHSRGRYYSVWEGGDIASKSLWGRSFTYTRCFESWPRDKATIKGGRGDKSEGAKRPEKALFSYRPTTNDFL